MYKYPVMSAEGGTKWWGGDTFLPGYIFVFIHRIWSTMFA